jgi:hypothetical protein
MDHIENNTSKNSSIVARIYFHGIMFTKPLPSDSKGIHIQTHILMGESYEYEICHSDGLRCHDICTKFHKDCFRHSKVNKGGYTDTQHGDIISLLLFF